jgi:uncharacterized repeat protein (TIGR01451 family)
MKLTKIVIILLLIANMVLVSNVSGNEDLSSKILVRIDIEDISDIEQLQSIGFYPIVEERSYIDGLIDESKENELEDLGYSFIQIKGDDLVQRIIKIYIDDKDDAIELAALGLDIWEVNDEYIVAMVFDNEIRTIKEQEFEVEIIYESGKEYVEEVVTKQREVSKSSALASVQESTPQYHSYESLKSDLYSLQNNNPNIAKVIDIGDSWENRDIIALKISDNVDSDDSSESDVLFMGGTHAREWISVEVPYYIAEYLVEHYSTDLEVRQLVDDNEIWIIPMVNPDGVEYSRTDDRNWRKNRRDNGLGIYGVDPNRNYGFHWGENPQHLSPLNPGGSSLPFSSTYWGPDAFSEPETQAIKNLVTSSNHNFVKSISYHSYSQYVMYPWGYTSNSPPNELQLFNMASKMSSEINNVGVEYTTMQSSNLYITYGGSDDWLYDEKNIAAFTIELRPSPGSDIGFLLPETQIIPTYEENLPAALYLIKWSQQLDIISPTSPSPVKVTDTSDPIEVIAEVKDIDGPISLYTNNHFTIKIGGIEANHILESCSNGRYKFKVYPPTELFPMTWKLEVEVMCTGGESKDIEDSAIQYPDHFGYTYRDSNNLGICGLESVVCDWEYDWIDITSTGTMIMPNNDDVYVESIPVGFFFNFYGTDYSQVSITNNGIVFASGGTGQYINQPIGSSAPHNFIAPFWDDLVTWGSAGAIYHQTLGTYPNRMFVVEWYDNQHYHNSQSGVTFEAILYEGTNNIKFQYKDVDFGTVYGSTSADLPPYDNGGSATVGIESPDGRGLQYSYNQQVLSPNLAILFEFPQFAGTNLYLSKQAPASKDRGSAMTYTLHYHNFGDTPAQNVMLEDTLPAEVEFISASDSGSYDSNTRKVTWNIGSVAPNGHGYETISVRISQSVQIGTVIWNDASISTSNLEVRYDDNEAHAQTIVTGSSLPPDVGVEPNNGGTGTPSIYWHDPITFSYHSCDSATGVDIRIHVNDGGPDITGSMAEGPGDWTYTTTFYPRHGRATITYTVYGCDVETVTFDIYIDPAGYIYDADTGERIAGATVWLQRPDGEGGWVNVPTGEDPLVSQPDENPLITGDDGQYQWDVLEGSYRVHVEADGYYPEDSIVVSIPPPVTDLHVGLTRIPSENEPPVAMDDSATTLEDTAVTINVTINDNDVDGNLDPTTANTDCTTCSEPAHGTLTNNHNSTFAYTPDPDYNGPDSFTYEICDTEGLCDTATVTTTVTPVNDAPLISVDLIEQTVQYSDGIATITISATDVDSSSLILSTSWTKDGGTIQPDLPANLMLSAGECILDSLPATCIWTIEGEAMVDAGDYDITFTLSDEVDEIETYTTLIVEPEDAAIAFDDGNPVAVKVAEAGGNSGVFTLIVDITETLPDLSDVSAPYPGEISSADVSVSLVPIGPGSPVEPTSCSGTESGTGYDATLTLICEFNDVMVNTYAVQITVGGGYYSGSSEDVLVIYDPSLGFTTGGGTFLWPETGEKTNFGYTMKYNKKGANIKGNLLLVRHLEDGTIYRVKSNALYGLALGESEDDGETYGWASFSGKATYLEPGWDEPIGNHEFITYVEDRDEPGNGVDRFWIKIKNGDNTIDVMSMDDPGANCAVEINGGNIVVPHK